MAEQYDLDWKTVTELPDWRTLASSEQQNFQETQVKLDAGQQGGVGGGLGECMCRGPGRRRHGRVSRPGREQGRRRGFRRGRATGIKSQRKQQVSSAKRRGGPELAEGPDLQEAGGAVGGCRRGEAQVAMRSVSGKLGNVERGGSEASR